MVARLPSPIARSQGNQLFRSEQQDKTLKRGQTTPYNNNGAPSGGTTPWGGIIGTLSAQTDLQAALNAKLSRITGTVASLPSAATVGLRAVVTDATATTFMSIVAGGGANKVPVFSDGTDWRIG